MKASTFVVIGGLCASALLLRISTHADIEKAAQVSEGWGPPVAPVLESLASAKLHPRHLLAGAPRQHVCMPKDPRIRPLDFLPIDPDHGQRDASAVADAAAGPRELSARMPATIGWQGISFTGYIPSDSHMACGGDYVLCVVNTSFAIFDKADGSRQELMKLDDFFSAILVDQESTFDPKAFYDSFSNRYIIVAMANDDPNGRSSWCIGISQTSDPLGDWWKYRFDATLNGSTPVAAWADYPGIGFDKTGFYMTANMYGFGDEGTFQGAKVRIVNKSKMYSGATLGWYDYWNIDSGNAFTLQVAHNYSGGSVDYLVNCELADTGSTLTLWKVGKATSSKPSFTKTKTINVASFSQPPTAQQKGGPIRIATNDTRLLNAVIRSGKLYTTHTIGYNWGSGPVSAMRWYEIQASNGALLQSSTYGLDKTFYYFPAVMPDAVGDVFFVFNRSSATEFAGIRVAGRQPSDPDDYVGPSTSVIDGRANYVLTFGGPSNRWGDYNGIALDPVATDTVWVFSQYAYQKKKWNTWFAHVGFE